MVGYLAISSKIDASPFIFQKIMLHMNTSARCLRSFAAGLAWLVLLFLVGILPTLLKTIPFNLSWYTWHDFKTTLYDLVFVVIFQFFLVLMNGCTNIILVMSIPVHLVFSMFMVMKLALVDFNQLIPASSAPLPIGIVNIKFFFYSVTVVSFLHFFLVLAIHYSVVPQKNKNEKTKTTTSFPVATKATPLLNPAGQISPAATKHATKESESSDSTKEDTDRLMEDDECPMYQHDLPELTTNHVLAITCLPVRVGCYSIFMVLLFPLGCLFSSFRACFQRCKKGQASDILHLPT